MRIDRKDISLSLLREAAIETQIDLLNLGLKKQLELGARRPRYKVFGSKSFLQVVAEQNRINRNGRKFSENDQNDIDQLSNESVTRNFDNFLKGNVITPTYKQFIVPLHNFLLDFNPKYVREFNKRQCLWQAEREFLRLFGNSTPLVNRVALAPCYQLAGEAIPKNFGGEQFQNAFMYLNPCSEIQDINDLSQAWLDIYIRRNQNRKPEYRFSGIYCPFRNQELKLVVIDNQNGHMDSGYISMGIRKLCESRYVRVSIGNGHFDHVFKPLESENYTLT